MEIKTTHGRVCEKVTVQKTQTPVPVKNGPDTPVPTVTLNFHVGCVCSEEILSTEAAQQLLISLQKILFSTTEVSQAKLLPQEI